MFSVYLIVVYGLLADHSYVAERMPMVIRSLPESLRHKVTWLFHHQIEMTSWRHLPQCKLTEYTNRASAQLLWGWAELCQWCVYNHMQCISKPSVSLVSRKTTSGCEDIAHLRCASCSYSGMEVTIHNRPASVNYFYWYLITCLCCSHIIAFMGKLSQFKVNSGKRP